MGTQGRACRPPIDSTWVASGVAATPGVAAWATEASGPLVAPGDATASPPDPRPRNRNAPPAIATSTTRPMTIGMIGGPPRFSAGADAAAADGVGLAAAGVATTVVAATAAAAAASRSVASRPASAAAPLQIANFGWASRATGRPVVSRRISPISGIRDVPPTSRIRLTSAIERPALATARSSASTVSRIRGRIIASSSARVRRTSVWSPGTETGIDVSVSVDRASLARRHSSRSRDEGGADGRVGRVELAQLAVERRVDVGEDRGVDVDAAQALDPLGHPDDLEPRLRLADHRSIERPAAEVVDGDDVARLDALLAGVVDGRRLGLGQQRHLVASEPRQPRRLAQEVGLELRVVRRVGEDDVAGRAALALADLGHDRAQHVGHERLGPVRRPADDDRRGVAEPALELAGGPRGLARGPPLRGLADEDLAVLAQDHDGGDRRSGSPEAECLHPSVARHGGRGVGGSQIDPKPVCHATSLDSPAASPI